MNTVLITGASSGIGLAFAKLFANQKYHLVIVSENETRLQAAATELRVLRAQVTPIAHDLSNPGAAEALCSTLASKNLAVDVLINNAGFATAGPFKDTNFFRETAEMQLNMVTLTQLTKLLLPAMLARRSGRILNVASTAAFLPGPFMAVYYATKAYVLNFSLALHEELRGSGVTVTALCPGPTATHFAAQAGVEKKRLFNRKLPTPAHVATAGYQGLMRGAPLVIHGWRNKLLICALRGMPRSTVVRYVARIQR